MHRYLQNEVTMDFMDVAATGAIGKLIIVFVFLFLGDVILN
jgi:hypothetical protein